MNRPYIAIPIGDPAGIGPEIVCAAIQDVQVSERAKCVIVGSKNAINYKNINIIEHPHEGIYEKGVLNLIDLGNIPAFEMGKISAVCGAASYKYIVKCIELAMGGQVQAVATTPINKEALKAANIPFIGHTEIFAHHTNTPDPLTMFQVHGMRVFFLSRHVSLRQACDMVQCKRIVDYVLRCTAALQKLGVPAGTMAIAGLNPHCGEHGLFGNEEQEIFRAVGTLTQAGVDVQGPISADSVFHLALQGKYIAVLSLYHDQGHIATKTLDFERTISITAGMPILRTSVDHGTAFDIAGKKIASAVSMVQAILVACEYAHNFRN